MHTRDVEKCEFNGTGGDRTRVANVMTKLMRYTQVEEGHHSKELAIPLLESGDVSDRNEKRTMFYLDYVEGVVCMLANDTRLA
jgi:hypothetical protein